MDEKRVHVILTCHEINFFFVLDPWLILGIFCHAIVPSRWRDNSADQR